MDIFSSKINVDRAQEMKSEFRKIPIPESLEASDFEVRNYLEKIVNMHFQNGSTPSGSIINISVQPSAPLKSLEHLIGLYVDQAATRSSAGTVSTPDEWSREWRNRTSHSTANPASDSKVLEDTTRTFVGPKDDRELMIALGGGRGAFLPEPSGVSYHLINVAGRVGVCSVGELRQQAQSDSLVLLTLTPKGHYTLELSHLSST